MDKPFRVQVFGKPECKKCHVLNQRLDRLLAKDEWQDFEKTALLLNTEEGLIAFSEAECINPQRIPAMLVLAKGMDGDYRPVRNPKPGAEDATCGKSRLFQYLGLQTDYSDDGRGVISPKMIASVLGEARQQAAN